MIDCFHERVFYYWRHGLMGHVSSMCEKAMITRRNDLFVYVWHALSLGYQKKTIEAFQELLKMNCRNDLQSTFLTCQYVLRLHDANSKEQPSLSELNIPLSILHQNLLSSIHDSNAFASFVSVLISIMTNNLELANEIVYNSNQSSEIKSMQGWIKLLSNEFKEAITIFDEAISITGHSNDIYPIYGKALALTELGHFFDAMQFYDKLISRYDFPELYLERARTMFAMRKWSNIAEIPEETIPKLISPLEINIFRSIYCLIYQADFLSANKYLDKLTNDLNALESNNFPLLIQLAILFCTISCHEISVIDHSLYFAYLAFNLNPSDSEANAVLAFLYIQIGNYASASKCLSSTNHIESYNLLAIESSLRLSLLTENYQNAIDQLDLFHTTSLSSFSLPCAYLEFLISNTTFSKDSKSKIHDDIFSSSFLAKAIKTHLNQFSINFGVSIASKLNFQSSDNSDKVSNNEIKQSKWNDFIKQIPLVSPIELPFEKIFIFLSSLRVDAIYDSINELTYSRLSICTVFQTFNSYKLIDSQEHCELYNILNSLKSFFPEFSPFRIVLANYMLYFGLYNESLSNIQYVLFSKWQLQLPLLLLTAGIIYLNLGNISFSKQCLESIRFLDLNNTKYIQSYYILQAKIEQMNHNDSKVQSIIDLFFETKPNFSQVLNFLDIEIEAKNYHLSSQLYNSCLSLVISNHDKFELLLRRAHLYAMQGHLSSAFNQLEELSKVSEYGKEAAICISNIYLLYMNNQIEYLKRITIADRTLLGEACFRVLQFDEAALEFSKILKFDNASRFDKSLERSSEICRKFLKSLINCHRYQDAINIFSKYLLYEYMGFLTDDILDQISQIPQIEILKKSLSATIHKIPKNHPLLYCNYHMLYGIILEQLNDINSAYLHYSDVCEVYELLLSENLPSPFKKEISEKCAQAYLQKGKAERKLKLFIKSENSYIHALELGQNNSEVVIELFEYYKMCSDQKKCFDLCLSFLNSFPNNEQIALLLSSLETNEYTPLIQCLKNVLDKHPNFHRVYVRYIEICYRAGRLFDIELQINQIKKSRKPSVGNTFIYAVYKMYTGHENEALHLFESIQFDSYWGSAAQNYLFYLMINPERKYNWMENLPLASEESIKKAEDLIRVISQNESERMIMNAEIELSRNLETSIHNAKKIFQGLLDSDQKNIEAYLGLARCLMKEEMDLQADKVLDLIFEEKKSNETCSFFEEAYLIRSWILIKKQNFLLAHHFVLKALDLNLSNRKGWEIFGKCHFESKFYSDAASAYRKSWLLGGKKNFNVGYQLAKCCLYSNFLDEAISIAREILDQDPLQQNLKDEIIVPAFKLLKAIQ